MTRLVAACAAALFAASAACVAEEARPERPRNVILMIGDGMGPSQVTLGRLVKGAPLAMDSITETALVTNHSLSGPATDSAAAATALASGVKTLNKRIGVDGEGRPLRLITEDLAERGWAIGIATTARLSHATPAGFYAHTPQRHAEPEIMKQLFYGRTVAVALGGGQKHEPPHEETYPHVRFFAESHMFPEIDRAGTKEPSLAEMTRMALADLERVRPGAPLFLMVEGARIDHACHSHDAAMAARETIAFDDAVRAALDFAARDGRTLVVVTADHATGGLAVSEKTDVDGLRRVRASAFRMLEMVEGDASKLREVVRELAGIDLSEAEAKVAIDDRWKYARGGSLAKILSMKLGVHFAYPLDVQDGFHSTEGHDATMVPLYAAGPGAERFDGIMDNTDVPKRIRELLQVR